MKELETKLERVITGLSSRLEEQELSTGGFDRYAFKLMKREGIFKGICLTNSYNIGYYHDILRDETQAEIRHGLRTTYVGLPEHFSEKALQDIEDYERLVSSAREHLMAKFGEKEIRDSQFERELNLFVFRYATKKLIFSPYRIGYLAGALSTRLKSEFKIGPATPSKVGDYERGTIDNVLRRL